METSGEGDDLRHTMPRRDRHEARFGRLFTLAMREEASRRGSLPDRSIHVVLQNRRWHTAGKGGPVVAHLCGAGLGSDFADEIIVLSNDWACGDRAAGQRQFLRGAHEAAVGEVWYKGRTNRPSPFCFANNGVFFACSEYVTTGNDRYVWFATRMKLGVDTADVACVVAETAGASALARDRATRAKRGGLLCPLVHRKGKPPGVEVYKAGRWLFFSVREERICRRTFGFEAPQPMATCFGHPIRRRRVNGHL